MRSLSKVTVKKNIRAKTNGKCAKCGGKYLEQRDPLRLPGERYMTLDHIIPKAKGGPNAQWNLIPMCNVCNGKKADNFEIELFGPNPPWEYYVWAAEQRMIEQRNAVLRNLDYKTPQHGQERKRR